LPFIAQQVRAAVRSPILLDRRDIDAYGVRTMLRVQGKRNWVFSLLIVNVAMVLPALLRIR